MATYNRTHASERMKRNNPMHKEASRRNMQATLRAKGHMPTSSGGNGTGPTQAQRMRAWALGWPMEFVIKTHLPTCNALHVPTSYKLDIANPHFMIAIEVDGGSHRARERQAQDRKKEQVLAGLRWTVLRCTNQDVTEHLADCVQMVLFTISR